MADCKKCLHAPVCEKLPKMPGAIVVGCDDFKDRTKWVERPKGRWVDSRENHVPFHNTIDYCPKYSCFCSLCGEWLTASGEYACIGKFCPNCGADMRGTDNDV